MSVRTIEITVNGMRQEVDVRPHRRLIDLLREEVLSHAATL